MLMDDLLSIGDKDYNNRYSPNVLTMLMDDLVSIGDKDYNNRYSPNVLTMLMTFSL